MENFETTDLGDVNDNIGKTLVAPSDQHAGDVPYLSAREEEILAAIEDGAISAYELSTILDCPVPSVRRSVQALRAKGHLINDARDNNGLYRLSR